MDTSASRSPKRAIVRSRLSPIVSPSNGVVDVPDAYDGSIVLLLVLRRSLTAAPQEPFGSRGDRVEDGQRAVLELEAHALAGARVAGGVAELVDAVGERDRALAAFGDLQERARAL